ncbi:ABC-three component system protein [Acinetobacter oleivorans]|uniref:ABC-three component system protein n=1 Tax=Acinetobacter oleivorans TaxID=1148157 RepID=UPI00125F41A3|nr:ABC-three component system protein [Acinetobacter oleivorans]
MDTKQDKFAAGAQGIGYIYQPRFALYHLLELPESTSVFIEKDDDLDFIDNENNTKKLASLKHKVEGEKLTDLATDFWKSIRVWCDRYEKYGFENSDLQFYLMTTNTISDSSILEYFKPAFDKNKLEKSLTEQLVAKANESKAKIVKEVLAKFQKYEERGNGTLNDFISRIVIIEDSPRIDEIAELIKERHLRTIRREHKQYVFDRLENWWNQEIIALLIGKRSEPLSGYELSDKMTFLADEYKLDNLPITWRDSEPDAIDPSTDNRRFVRQLKLINISTNRIRSAIIDYYRAFEQRAEWLRYHLVLTSEIESFEKRLVDELIRYKDVLIDDCDDIDIEEEMVKIGKKLYKWVEMDTGNYTALRLRERVSEPFVVRGAYHILAHDRNNCVGWHLKFKERLEELLIPEGMK